jgi:hypothetical protein
MSRIWICQIWPYRCVRNGQNYWKRHWDHPNRTSDGLDLNSQSFRSTDGADEATCQAKIVSAKHWIKTQCDDVARWCDIHVINPGPTFDDVANTRTLVWWHGSWWRGGWLCRIAGVVDDWLLAWRVNPVQLQTIGWGRRVESVARVVARGQCCRRRVLERAVMQDVGSSPGFHQWILLVFLYVMVMSKTRFENFYFWVWIKHPLFQEQALIPVVGQFQNSNTHKFTWFGNLPTPRSYWFVLIKLRNNTNNKTRRRRKNLLYSTQALSLTFFSLCFHSSLCFSHTSTPALHWAYIYIKLGVKGINHAMIYAHRLPPLVLSGD